MTAGLKVRTAYAGGAQAVQGTNKRAVAVYTTSDAVALLDGWEDAYAVLHRDYLRLERRLVDAEFKISYYRTLVRHLERVLPNGNESVNHPPVGGTDG